MIYPSTGDVLSLPETGNDILLYSDGKIRMQYVVSYPDPNGGDGTRGTMAVTLTLSDTAGFVPLGLTYDSGGLIGYQAVVCIP